MSSQKALSFFIKFLIFFLARCASPNIADVPPYYSSKHMLNHVPNGFKIFSIHHEVNLFHNHPQISFSQIVHDAFRSSQVSYHGGHCNKIIVEFNFSRLFLNFVHELV